MGERLTIDNGIDLAARRQDLEDELRRELAARPRRIPSKYFYDDRGSWLFEKITELPEYYPTRTELSILQQIADTLVRKGGYQELVELGSGSATKTRTLLDAMERSRLLARYIPVDVSEGMLRESTRDLLERYPLLEIHAVVGDFQRDLSRVPRPRGRRLVIFLGSTIGNLEEVERAELLVSIRALLEDGDAFLLGVDLVKDVDVIERAYNDSAGVTAEFNRNILNAINQQFDADFQPEAFAHRAFYNPHEDRIEMHLVASAPQRVSVRRLGLVVEIVSGENIRTEISCKFTQDRVAMMLEATGFRLADWYTDPAQLFGLALAAPR